MNKKEGIPLLKFEGATFSYTSKGAPAVAGCTFCVKEGEFISLVGHNSSGKSTIAKMSNGLLKPISGSVSVHGLTTSDDENLLQIRKTVGLVFQNPDNQTVASQVEDDVAFGPENLNLPQPEIRQRVDEALSTVGLLDLAKHPVHHLSGGQKQLVAIAGILAIKTKLIILDEATSLLDPKGRKGVLAKISQLNDDGYAIIMITHRMEEVLLTKRSIALEKGSIIYDGTPEGLFKDKDLLFRAGLQRPPIVDLAECLIENGINILFPNNPDELVEALCQLK
jgi:energy-coupling factor transport system ATP-binding protein